jgi:hypothetical protein
MWLLNATGTITVTPKQPAIQQITTPTLCGVGL